MHVAIVGAGLAGLICARDLRGHGAEVVVFDKGKRPGGRVGTRHARDYVFDYGAPWLDGPAAVFDGFGLRQVGTHWASMPDMAALPLALAAGMVESSRHVAFLKRSPAGWFVRHHDAGQTAPGYVSDQGGSVSGPFDAVVLAIPAPQAASLLRVMAHAHAAIVSDVTMAPCWTLMAAFDQAGPRTPVGSARPFQFVGCVSDKPGRVKGPECWVAHATDAWSLAHLEQSPAVVRDVLLAGLVDAIGRSTPPDYCHVHRWRYARTVKPAGKPCIVGDDGLVVCGDWCLGANASDAVTSGHAAAAAVFASRESAP